MLGNIYPYRFGIIALDTKKGFEIIWANDFDPDSVKTYRRNFGNHIVLGDIEKIRTNLFTLPKLSIHFHL